MSEIIQFTFHLFQAYLQFPTSSVCSDLGSVISTFCVFFLLCFLPSLGPVSINYSLSLLAKSFNFCSIFLNLNIGWNYPHRKSSQSDPTPAFPSPIQG